MAIKLFRFFVFALLIPFCTSSMASNTILIDDDFTSQENLLSQLSFWKGDKTLKVTELAEQRSYFSLWGTVESTKEIASWQNTGFKLTLKNASHEKKQLVLVLSETLVDSATLLQIDPNGQVIRQDSAGNNYNFDQRPNKHRYIIFPIDIEAGKTIDLVAQVKGRLDRFDSALTLWQRNAFYERTDKRLVMQSVYATLLLIFAIYASFLVFIVREYNYSYLWFSLFTFSLFVRIMTMNNFLFEFVWPNWPNMQNIAFALALLGTSLSMALFAKAYLSLEEKKPHLGKVFDFYAFMHLPLIVLFIITGWQLQYLIIWMLPTWLFSLVILHTSIRCYREGQGDALPFFIAYLITIAMSFLSIGNHLFSLGLPWVVDGEVAELILIVTLAVTLSLRIGQAQANAQIRLAQSTAKNEFLAKMSHEIRTPINGVLGMVQLLQESTLTRKQQHYADVINHCGRTLLNVINDILEYSKIEAGKLELEQQAFRLDELLQKHNDIFWPQIQKKSLGFNFHLAPEPPLHFIGDPSRIQQILNNVFSNAVKFTERGQIDFSVKVSPIDQQNALLNIVIKDTGIGMSREEQERVFAPFVQANSTTNRRYGGSGLGLNITLQLIKLMRGELQLESQTGVGSCFVITLPLRIDEQAEQKWQHDVKQLNGKQIMLLTEQEPQQDEVHQILTQWGIAPFYFQDDSEAFNFIEHTNHTIDLLMISKEHALNMSVLDKNTWNEQANRILIYSNSFANSDTRVFGFEKPAFLKQPYSFSLLYDKFNLLFGNDQEIIQNKLLAPEGARLNCPNTRILVAEDDATNRLVIRAILKKLQLEHEIVADGKLALDLYTKNPEAFDVIIMDYEMPVLDGCQATTAIRQFEKERGLKPIPVIALTAHVLEEYQKRCLASGMNMVLAKPIIISDLVASLNQFCAGES